MLHPHPPPPPTHRFLFSFVSMGVAWICDNFSFILQAVRSCHHTEHWTFLRPSDSSTFVKEMFFCQVLSNPPPPHPLHHPPDHYTCAQLVHVNFQLKLIQLYSRTVTSLCCSSSIFSSSSSSSCSLSLLFFKSTLRVCIPVHVR